ncbi:extracellular solute-binding protein [Paenibacillus sp. N3/727]|uniref:extracellular solute-binding protein n=1 Tax=Paenibacillus sp. N3/727 TaxID=2925845 RepID=UPI001F52BA4D|nr:extracellular solute-binding protein [Paenibacillus sp. N3/727]UNK16436.1 extracellular solute-binding protein [Paenibacillus sp. N3/727]
MLRRRNEFNERYERFLQELRNEIVSGTLLPGEFILPENTLSQKYEMSRVSIRKALEELVNEGLIEKIAGKGNRVKLPGEDLSPVVLKLAWFSSSYEIHIVQKIIEAFERKHPFVKVEIVLYSEDNYTDTIIALLEDQQGPDVFMMSDSHYRHWVESKRTDMVTGYVPPHLLKEGVSYPEVFRLFQHDNRILAAPFIFSPVVICFNRSIFRQYGLSDETLLENWSDLLHTAKTCTVKPNEDGMIEQFGFGFSSSPNRWPVFLMQNDGKMMTEDRSRSTMANERNIESLEFCLSLMYKEHVSPIYSHGSSHLAERLFMKERVAMIMSTYYFMNEFRDHSIEWDVMQLPKGRKPATLLLGGGLSISASSSHRSVAERLVDFMTGEEAQKLIKQYGCTIPVLRSVAEDDSLLTPDIHPKHYNRYLDVLPHAHPLHSLNLSQSEILMLFDELNLLWAGMENPTDTCNRIEELFNNNKAALKPS